MGLFSKEGKEKSFLGVDIGGSSVKLVELAPQKNRSQLVTYGYMERSMKTSDESLLENPQEMATALKKVAEKAKAKSNNAITALPASAVFSTILGIPEISKKDLASTKKVTEIIENEAKKVKTWEKSHFLICVH